MTQDYKLPPLPEWSKMDNLAGLVPSEIRKCLNEHARAAIALDRQGWGDQVKALLQQARRVRNYSDPGQVFDAVPVSAFGSGVAPQPAAPAVKDSLTAAEP
ncbi:MAG: hypothetical protein WBF88_17720 [Pusillimonas sp.]